ncbi:MAG: hypothetical protein WD005_03620, partial [Haliea sp.]
MNSLCSFGQFQCVKIHGDYIDADSGEPCGPVQTLSLNSSIVTSPASPPLSGIQEIIIGNAKASLVHIES